VNLINLGMKGPIRESDCVVFPELISRAQRYAHGGQVDKAGFWFRGKVFYCGTPGNQARSMRHHAMRCAAMRCDAMPCDAM
jgi:hypothetical protein